MSKNIFSRSHAILAVAIASLVIAGCDYKDLGEVEEVKKDMMNVTLSFKWNAVDSIPSRMRVAFYPEKYPRGYTFFDVLNRDTVIQVPAGTYNIVAWNKDILYARTNGYTSHNTIYATTGPASPHGNYQIPVVLDSLFPGMQVLDYPDYMVHGYEMGKEIIKEQENRVIISPDSMVVTVDVKLHGIAGLEYCNSIRGCINNLAGKRYVSFDNLTEDRVAMMYDANFSSADSTVTAYFWIFGLHPTDTHVSEHKMVMFFWLKGVKVYIPIDITKACAAYTNEDKHILIESPDLKIDLKEYIHQVGGGFDVSVDGWINNDIPMNF